VSPLSTLSISSLCLQSEVLGEDVLDRNHIVISVELKDGLSLPTHVLVDCGVTEYAFADEEFARDHNLPLFKLKQLRFLEVIDGWSVESGMITHLTKVEMNINNYKEIIPMFIIKLGHYPIVLGLPWLQRHDVDICFTKNSLIFNSNFCLSHCCPRNAVTISGISIDPPEKINISMIAGSTFTRTLRKNKGIIAVFKMTLFELDQALCNYENKNKEPLTEENRIKELVPKDYHEYLPLFKKAVAEVLPPHCPYDHKIPLKEGFTPPFGPLYCLSKLELQALRQWIDENLSKGFIRASSSPASAPILFVKKKDGSLRLCVDYRGLNEGTIKNRYPLSLIRETLIQLSKARYYTTLDVRGAYNLLRMAEGEEWKIAFRSRYGLFESLVMPFGLTNAPADFQWFINDVLYPFLNNFYTAYLDDILIYSETLAEHKVHVMKVLEVLAKAGLYLKPEKCEFHKTEVRYLGISKKNSLHYVRAAHTIPISRTPRYKNRLAPYAFSVFASLPNILQLLIPSQFTSSPHRLAN